MFVCLFDYNTRENIFRALLNVTVGQLEAHVKMGLPGQVDDLCQMDGQHGGLVQVVLGKDTQLGLFDQFLGFVHVGSLRMVSI